MIPDKTAALNDAIQTVLGLADNELCSLYAVARRDGDSEVEKQADEAAKALTLAEPLLKAAPKMLEVLRILLMSVDDEALLITEREMIEEAIARATGTDLTVAL